jgi:hypothetical protein
MIFFLLLFGMLQCQKNAMGKGLLSPEVLKTWLEIIHFFLQIWITPPTMINEVLNTVKVFLIDSCLNHKMKISKIF